MARGPARGLALCADRHYSPAMSVRAFPADDEQRAPAVPESEPEPEPERPQLREAVAPPAPPAPPIRVEAPVEPEPRVLREAAPEPVPEPVLEQRPLPAAPAPPAPVPARGGRSVTVISVVGIAVAI